jgi:hypothetical protein
MMMATESLNYDQETNNTIIRGELLDHLSMIAQLLPSEEPLNLEAVNERLNQLTRLTYQLTPGMVNTSMDLLLGNLKKFGGTGMSESMGEANLQYLFHD